MNYQLSRRSFLRATSATVLTQLLLGCSDSQTILKILFLSDSIPPQLIGDFRKSIGKKQKVDFKPQPQLKQIFDSLFDWQQAKKPEQKNGNLLSKIFNKSVINPNLTTLGDSWLAAAIKQNLIQPLSVESLANWQNLPPTWQKIVRRDNQGNLATEGQVWGAPYRWGSVVIAYRSDKLNQSNLKIEDWHDLWQPELSDRISLLDSPREVIGLTLKKLGKSYNRNDLDSIPELEKELLALHKQVKLYSSNHYLEPLILGDTWATVAWSTDILPLLKRYPEIKLVIPQSGTSLWADVWVKPQQLSTVTNNEDISAAIDTWINFCWEVKAATQISLFTDGISPILATVKPTELSPTIEDNLWLNSEVLNSTKSEFLLPLQAETQQQYQDLWLKIRQSG